jgi:hypothetical protein
LVLWQINKIDKSLANLTKMRREKSQSNKIRNEKGEKAPRKFRESSGSTCKTYIHINWRI